MKITSSTRIKTYIEEVFKFLLNEDKLKQWVDGLESVEYLFNMDEYNPVGAKFKLKISSEDKVNEYNGEIVAYDKPRLLAVKVFIDNIETGIIFNLESVLFGTKLNSEVYLMHEGIYKKNGGFLFKWNVKKVIRGKLDKMKIAVENSRVH